MSKQPNSEALDARLAKLPTQEAPPAAVWAAIEQEITASVVAPEVGQADALEQVAEACEPATTAAPNGLGSSLREYATAALFAAVTAAIIVVGFNDSVMPPRFAEVQPFEVEGLDRNQLMRVRDNLHSSLQLALDDLAPQTRQVVVENLARIDAARYEIDEALKNDPANQLLKQMLLSSYTNEITLLNEFTVMAHSAPQRTQL